MIYKQQLYRIGVDVGGTNTDAALVAASFDNGRAGPHIKIIDSSKKPTTENVTDGICASIQELLNRTGINRHQIDSVNIGTTHFINAIVQADSRKLARVAVLRLCGPFCREVAPFADFPAALRDVIEGPVRYLEGGLEIDGRTIGKVGRNEVESCAQAITDAGISSIVINGVFAPLDSSDTTQEQEVKAILLEKHPGLDIVCSRDIGRLGFLERENASILNAAVLELGRQTIGGFQQAVDSLGIECPLYLTQNDGTVVDASAASRIPVKTFSSGATNSLMGAIFLAGIHDADSSIDLTRSQVIMCDVGGTTSDFAALSPSGLPRQSAATVKVGGVRTSFSMPEVMSIGLGGGSKVTASDGLVNVGPLSVGHRLLEQSKCFGGNVLTATDIAVLSGIAEMPEGANTDIQLPADVLVAARKAITHKLENGIDAMKTSDLPVILLMVGGGSIIATEPLRNVSRSIRPNFSHVANAVGAAIAKISGDVDIIVIPQNQTLAEIKAEVAATAVQNAVERGALPESVQVLELDLIPLQYVNNGAVRAVAKAVGELGWARSFKSECPTTYTRFDGPKKSTTIAQNSNESRSAVPAAEVDVVSYRPEVSKPTGEWFISATDLMFIYEGTGVLGTGGGGSGYTAYLNSLAALAASNRKRMRVIDPTKLRDNDKIAAVAYVGAPSVSNERLCGARELEFATEALARYESIDGFAGVVSAEIGGSNGMRTFTVATELDIPVLDADTMGRAFPRVDMALPYVYGVASPAPSVVTDARGNVQIVAGVDSAKRFEDSVRAIAIELGLYTGMSLSFSGDIVRRYCCQRSLSTAWFIGQAICVARSLKLDIVSHLEKAIQGCRRLFSGKVVNVARNVEGGWTVGTATLEPQDDERPADLLSRNHTNSPEPAKNDDRRHLELKYQNEFLYAALRNADGTLDPLCTVPDLIAVLDQNGTAVGTHELRYGLKVSVISMPCHPLWKTEQGMQAGGPEAFKLGMAYQEYRGQSAPWRSVIEEYGV